MSLFSKIKKVKFSGFKHHFKDIILQLIPVTLGVFLGIVAGDYNQSLNRDEQQRIFLDNITNELTANSKKLERSYKYHASVSTKLDSLMEQIEESELSKPFLSDMDFSVIPGWRGINVPTLENSVFESGIISDALSGLDFKTINSIAVVYNYQKEYKDITKSLTNRFINVNSQTTFREVVLMVEILVTDIKEMERNMVDHMNQVVTSLEKKL